MLVWVVLSLVVVGVSVAVYTWKSMRPIDRLTMFMKIMQKTRFVLLLVKSGRMRSKVSEITAPNGIKLKAPSPILGVTLDPVSSFKARNDDVFLATYPKAGTTWLQEITWLVCNNADITAAKLEAVTRRSPFLESPDIDHDNLGIQALEKWSSGRQRIIKTHLPYKLLPEEVTIGKKGKIIVGARNPKDLCVSYYHFHLMNQGMPDPGTWSEFLTRFCSGDVGFGSWFPHTLKYWEEYQADKDQIFFTTYEAMKKDLRSEVVSIAKFLDKQLTEEQIDAIATHCTFDSMSKNKQTNYAHAKDVMDFKKSKFMRKGQVGDWKNYFTLNENVAFDEMYKRKMEGTGLTIPFEL